MTLPEWVDLLFVRPSSIVAIAAVIVTVARSTSAAVRYCVWAGAVAAILLLPASSLVLPDLRLPILPAGFELRLGELIPSARTSASNDVGAPGNPRWAGAITGRGTRGAVQSDQGLANVMTTLWLIGVLGFAARRIAAGVRVCRLLRQARPVAQARILRLFRTIAVSCGARVSPAVLRISDDIVGPATAGVRRGVVLLPAAAVHWTDKSLSAVFAHELGHVARRDCLLNLFADLTAILYWCNPVVRLAVRRIKSESERDCDDRVLRSGTDPDAYARLLLSVARTGRLEGESPEPAIAMSRARELESRLRSVLDARLSRRPLPRWMPAVIAVGAMLCSLPAAALSVRAAGERASRILGSEPDLAGDALASSASERLPAALVSNTAVDTTRLFAGADSALARHLVAALNHVPSDASDLVRDRAEWALSKARAGQLVEPLLAALDAPDWRVRAYAAWALAGTPDPRLVPRLRPLLGSPVWRLRAMAAFAIRASADPRAEPEMAAALTDPAWQVRLEAVEYFTALGASSHAERLEPRLADRHVAVRLAADRAFNP